MARGGGAAGDAVEMGSSNETDCSLRPQDLAGRLWLDWEPKRKLIIKNQSTSLRLHQPQRERGGNGQRERGGGSGRREREVGEREGGDRRTEREGGEREAFVSRVILKCTCFKKFRSVTILFEANM